jgi:hypothetical protein
MSSSINSCSKNGINLIEKEPLNVLDVTTNLKYHIIYIDIFGITKLIVIKNLKSVCKKTYNSVFYDAKFYKNEKHYYLGTYETLQIAAYAYNCKKISLGDRTKLNNVDLSNDYNWNDNINRLIKINIK